MQGGVVVGNGLGTLEDNDIFGNAFSGVEITDGGKPILRRNTIRDGQQNGVLVQKDGEGTLEDNDIFGNATTGVLVRRAGNPTLRSNRVNSNEMWGVWISDNGRGLFEDNDLTGNRRGSWRIAKDSKANVRRVRNRQRALRTGSDSSNE
jgi:F-box protein 11